MGNRAMGDTVSRQELKSLLDGARAKIRSHTGLYPDEDLARDVLRLCDAATLRVKPHPRLREARRIVEDRCNRLAQATDRFAVRDIAAIGMSKAQAVAAIDVLQDVVLGLCKTDDPGRGLGPLLKRRSL